MRRVADVCSNSVIFNRTADWIINPATFEKDL